MQERMTLSNMSAELGAQVGLIAPDATTRGLAAGARRAGRRHRAVVHRRRGAGVTRHRFDAATLAPQVAAPHSPANAHGVSRATRGTPIDVAYIGACTGAKLDDLRAAAQVLRGRKVAAACA